MLARLKRKIVILFALTLFFGLGFGQTKEQIALAHDLRNQGLQFLENEEFGEALHQFRYAQRLIPEDIELSILIGQTLFRQELYEEVVIEIISLAEGKNSNDRCYQLLGNSFDMLGRTEDAVKMYKKGLYRFPQSAALYMELGILEYARGNDSIARSWWEQGIEANPTAASNYYWAAKSYAHSREPIRAIIYAEIYINMDRASERTREMSRLLYQTLQRCIIIDSSGTIEFKFSSKIGGDYSMLNMKKVKKMSFEEAYTFLWYLSFMDPADSVNLKVLLPKRNKFARIWSEMLGKKRPVRLFEWHRYLISQGYFEPYHYWLFYDGDAAAYKKWYDANKDVYWDFEKWFVNHPMPIEPNDLHGPALFRVK